MPQLSIFMAIYSTTQMSQKWMFSDQQILNKMDLEENIVDDELRNEVKKKMLNSIGYVL